jgi:hypothetical protein
MVWIALALAFAGVGASGREASAKPSVEVLTSTKRLRPGLSGPVQAGREEQ